MDLMGQAIEALGERIEDLRRAERGRVLQLADAIIDAAAEFATDGPVGAAKEALKAAGGMIGDVVIMDTGGSTDDILNRLVDELSALAGRVADEQEQVRKAIDDLDEFLNGEDKDIFVPRPVPAGSPLHV